jgi:heme/copper-type cytochrome/quinol oxidase subunit 2
LFLAANDDAGDPGKDSRKENDLTTPVVIFIILIICLLGIACTVFLVVRKRRRKSHDSVGVPIVIVIVVKIWNLIFWLQMCMRVTQNKIPKLFRPK